MWLIIKPTLPNDGYIFVNTNYKYTIVDTIISTYPIWE